MSPEAIRYGPDRGQVAEVWRPEDAGAAPPVVVLIHGGFWRQQYTKRLMHRLARAVTARGWIAYNVEYRRVGRFGRGGWPETFEDVSDAIEALAHVDGVDRRRVVTCGHSAGGQLALWAASARSTGDPERAAPCVGVVGAASLAGVVDLERAARHAVGGGAVEALLGGGPDHVPERYRLASPAALLPLGTRQLLLHGLADGSVPAALSERYAADAVRWGDSAVYVPLPGVGHMEMISGRGTAFEELARWLEFVFGPSQQG
ncbi:MAG: alpha/beta fold hydrolase [Acidimicrobiales bacterium]